MRFFGIVLIVISLLSAALILADMNFIFLNWINSWGLATGWWIRGGIFIVGVVLYFLGKPFQDE